MKVLFVDDHALVREALGRLITLCGEAEVIEASDGEAALAAASAQRFDLAVLDLNLPRLGGLELLGRLLEAAPGLPILVLTMNLEPVYLRKAIEMGARGYMTKNASTEEILAAIRTVGRGRPYVQQSLAQALAFAEPVPEAAEAFTGRELEILRHLANGSTLGEIAQVMGVAYKTVANTCSRLKAKCNTTRTLDLIRVADRLQLG